MLSENSQHSEFALRELDFADKKGKHVVIVNVENCTMTDEFQFLYGLTDTIIWPDKLQREKLFHDLKLWIGLNTPTEPIYVGDTAIESDEKARLDLEHLINELRLKEVAGFKKLDREEAEALEKIEKGHLVLEQMLKEEEERKSREEAEKIRIKQEQEKQERKGVEEERRLEQPNSSDRKKN